MIRQPNAAIRPVPECQLAEHAIAWQRKAQPELRGEIQTRDAELVRSIPKPKNPLTGPRVNICQRRESDIPQYGPAIIWPFG